MKLNNLRLLFLAWLLLPLTAMAQSQAPRSLDDMDPETLMSAGFAMMKLSPDEKKQFSAMVEQFNGDVHSAIETEMRRNAPNLQRRIKRRVNVMFKRLDKRVAPIVTKAREQGYLIFKKGLAERIRGTSH